MPFSGVILDIEFTQKLQNIMGKGMQTPANNTPTGANTKTMPSADLVEQDTNHSAQINRQNSGGNSRFSVSPVSETKCSNISVMEGELTILLPSSLIGEFLLTLSYLSCLLIIINLFFQNLRSCRRKYSR